MKKQTTDEPTCSNPKHQKLYLAYKYCCVKCVGKNKPCKYCRHNVYFCTICKKPVKMIGGMYYYVGKK